jgi:sugar phosphate isomerase/epimerase
MPRLLSYLNWLTLEALPEPREGWLKAIRESGYDGVQFIEPLSASVVSEARTLGLRVCGSGRANVPADAARLAEQARAENLECLTLHVGWGNEEDDAAHRLIESVLEAAVRYSIPLYVETHRATIFQDTWRTVNFIRRYPELQFNGDFSNWYTGLEFVYGDFNDKVAFIQPVIDRTVFMHGRIGNPCVMQVDVGTFEQSGQLPFVQHFRTLWSRVFRSFLQRDVAGDFRFAPELLSSRIYYAREIDGREESDRWAQSLVLVQIARDCFELSALDLQARPAARA